jgi:hypothetical protein
MQRACRSGIVQLVLASAVTLQIETGGRFFAEINTINRLLAAGKHGAYSAQLFGGRKRSAVSVEIAASVGRIAPPSFGEHSGDRRRRAEGKAWLKSTSA